MLQIFSDWIIAVYKGLYYPHDLISDIDKLDKAYQEITGITSFNTIINVILTFGISIMLIYFFIDLSEKSVSGMLSFQQLFLAFLKLVCVALLMSYSQKIMDGCLAFGNSLANEISLTATATEESWFDQTTQQDVLFVHVGELKNSDLFPMIIGNLKILTQLSYTIKIIIPYLVTLAAEAVFYFLMVSRIAELSVRFLFAPIAIADAFSDTRRSTAIRYLKKVLSLAIQFAVAVAICFAINIMIQGISPEIPNPADVFGYVNSDRGIEAKDPDLVKRFLDALVGGSYYWPCIGLGVAKVYLLLKSLTLSNDIIGV